MARIVRFRGKRRPLILTRPSRVERGDIEVIDAFANFHNAVLRLKEEYRRAA